MFFLVEDQAEAYLLRVSLYIDEQMHEEAKRVWELFLFCSTM